MRAGEQLKEIRNRLGITTRDVEEYSRKIADAEGSDEFYVSNAWLTQVENKVAIPSIFKLYSLSIIYRIKFTDLLQMYGVDLEKISRYQIAHPLPNTHLAGSETPEKNQAVSFPVRFDPGFKPEQTNLLSRMVQEWADVPFAHIQKLDRRNTMYGYIGIEDLSMYPVLPPGSLVQIDDKQTKLQKYTWHNDYERPIHFFMMRNEYACSYWVTQGSQITLVPHQLSPESHKIRTFPASDVEVLGRVTHVALKLPNAANGNGASPASDSPKSPKLS